MSFPLCQALKCLQDFSKIVAPSFGPQGKDVLVRSATGSIFVTKQGSAIIESLQARDPMGVVVLKTVQEFLVNHGDFSKTFIMILSHFLESVVAKFFTSATDAGLNDRNSHLMRTSAVVVDGLRVALNLCRDSVTPKLLRSSRDIRDVNVLTVVTGIVDSVICCMFAQETRSIFKELLVELLLREQSWAFLKSRCAYLATCFDEVCVNVDGMPVSESQVIDGFVILRDVSVKSACFEERCKLIIFSDKSNDGSQISLVLGERSIRDVASAEQCRHSTCADALYQSGVKLVLCSSSIPSSFAGALSRRGIIYVQHVAEEDTLRLQRAFRITSTSLADVGTVACGEANVGEAQFLKVIVVGKRCGLHVGPPTLDDGGHVQLLLCSMSPALGARYSSVVLSCVRSVRAVFGACKYLPESVSSEFRVSVGCGATEMFVSACLREEAKQASVSDHVRAILELLAQAYLRIPQALFANSLKSSTFRRFVELELALNAAGLPHWGVSDRGSPVDVLAAEVFEPLSSKLALLFGVLELALQLARIDACIPVVTSKRTKHGFEVAGKM